MSETNGHATAPPPTGTTPTTARSESRSSASATAPTAFIQGVQYYKDADPAERSRV